MPGAGWQRTQGLCWEAGYDSAGSWALERRSDWVAG